MRRKKKDQIVICRKCGGNGWIAAPLVQGETTHKVKRTIKNQRCPACGGKGKFVT